MLRTPWLVHLDVLTNRQGKVDLLRPLACSTKYLERRSAKPLNHYGVHLPSLTVLVPLLVPARRELRLAGRRTVTLRRGWTAVVVLLVVLLTTLEVGIGGATVGIATYSALTRCSSFQGAGHTVTSRIVTRRTMLTWLLIVIVKNFLELGLCFVEEIHHDKL